MSAIVICKQHIRKCVVSKFVPKNIAKLYSQHSYDGNIYKKGDRFRPEINAIWVHFGAEVTHYYALQRDSIPTKEWMNDDMILLASIRGKKLRSTDFAKLSD